MADFVERYVLAAAAADRKEFAVAGAHANAGEGVRLSLLIFLFLIRGIARPGTKQGTEEFGKRIV
jgi:hypothetical protein